MNKNEFWFARLRHAVAETIGFDNLKKIDRALRDSAENADEKATKPARWIADLIRICDELNSRNRDTASLFWVRLWELLDSGPRLLGVDEDFGKQMLGTPAEQVFLAKRRCIELLDAMKREFSVQELWVIEFNRHTQCHIVQTSLHIQATGSVKNGFNLLDKYKDSDRLKIRQAIEVERKNYDSEADAAISFAFRIRHHLDELFAKSKVGTLLDR